jgi:methionyl-tRNA formyltransferase
VPLLEALAACGSFEIAFVVSRPDSRAGRGLKVARSPVAIAAGLLGIPLRLESKLGVQLRQELTRIAPAVALSADFGLWIPPWLLSLPKAGVVNVHPSLLPRHRGAAPVQWTILEGDSRTGVSFMLTDRGWDTGPVISDIETRVLAGETAGELEGRLARLAAESLPDVLARYLSGALLPRPQEGQPSSAPRILASEASIDWLEPAEGILRKILAMNPEPCARTVFRGRPLRILRAERSDSQGSPGGIIRASKSSLAVGCGSGSVEIVELQPESRKVMSAMAFCAGYNPAEGERLG